MKVNQKGFSLIELLIVIVVVGIVAAIAIPSLLAARRAANETSAIGSLRTITKAQASYKSGKSTFGTLADLNSEGLIDDVLGCNAPPCFKSGYNYSVAADPASPEFYWNGTSTPLFPTGLNATGKRFFYTNESFVIYSNVGSIPVVDANRNVTNGTPID